MSIRTWRRESPGDWARLQYRAETGRNPEDSAETVAKRGRGPRKPPDRQASTEPPAAIGRSTVGEP